MSERLDADDYEVTLENGDTVRVVELVDSVELSAGKKIQLEQFEPIDEQASITARLPDLDSTDRLTIIEGLSELARDVCEENVARRYEEHVRAEAFGDD